MTIAACYISGEGVVLGADSTSTISICDPHTGGSIEHHFNFGQKVFEVGERSTLGIATWGCGSLFDESLSYRTLVALFADQLASGHPVASMDEVAQRWTDLFWSRYAPQIAPFRSEVERIDGLPEMPEHDRQMRERIVNTLTTGFCIGGYLPANRIPAAYEIVFDPTMTEPPTPFPLAIGRPRFWGWQNIVNRLVWGVDGRVFDAIKQSGKWMGTDEELVSTLLSHQLASPSASVPLREAVDWVHASISATIKTMKFSHFAPYCGGPIEIAVISTDRPFRWVAHKGFDEAIGVSPRKEGR